jgi:hypothetical protein
VIEFNWRPFMWNIAGQYDTVYGAWQSDWMGSNSTEGDTDLFTRTSVHNDRLTGKLLRISGNGRRPTSLAFPI